MSKGRLEAFSDGVLAILITIMVLELKAPHSADPDALKPLVPALVSYLLSFVFLGIYWNNHHHLLQAARQVTGGVLWANLHLLFWLSLIPFVTAWMGDTHFESVPVAGYGVVMLMSGVGYYILSRTLIRAHGEGDPLPRAVGRDTKGVASLVLYAVAVPLAFAAPWAACVLYVIVAVMWLVPDPRIETVLTDRADPPDEAG